MVGFLLPILAGGNVFFVVDVEPALAMFTVIAMGFALLWILGRPASATGATPALAALLLFSATWLAHYGLRPSGPSAATTTRGIVLAAILFTVLRRRRLRRDELDAFVAATILGTLVTVAYGQYQYWMAFPRIEPIIRASGLTPILSVNASFYNANCYAAFLAAVAILGTALLSRRTSTPLRILACGALPAILGTLWLTGSRATLAILAATTATAVLARRAPRTFLARPSLWAAIAALTGLLVIALRYSELVQVGLLGRLRFWTASLRMIADHLFLGVGIGLFGEAFPVYRLDAYYTRYPHNFWLEVFTETGLVTALSLAAFLFFAFRSACAPLRPDVEGGAIGEHRIAATTAACLMLVHASVDIDWHAPANPILLFVLLGIAGASGASAVAAERVHA